MKIKKKYSPKNMLVIRILAAAFTVLLISCDDPLDVKGPIEHIEKFPIGPEGGTISALSGNITLTIPNGALNEQVLLTFKEGPIDFENEFVIKSIEVSPSTTFFKIPASISLKYNGQLSCGLDPCNSKCLVLYHFRNEMAFDKRNPSDMLWVGKCCIDRMNCCIDTEIRSGGIFAIGEDSLGQPALFTN